MPIFYRAVRPGSSWHRDARIHGFNAWNPSSVGPGRDRIIQHITDGDTEGPFVSLTKSFPIAWGYAVSNGASQVNPGFVYEIELPDDEDGLKQLGIQVIDPITEVVNHASSKPFGFCDYHHNGDRGFMIGVMDPTFKKAFLKKLCRLPGNGPGKVAQRPTAPSQELEVLVRVLRDSEVLIIGTVPSKCVSRRYDVYP